MRYSVISTFICLFGTTLAIPVHNQGEDFIQFGKNSDHADPIAAREETVSVNAQFGVGQGGDTNYVDVGVRDEKREERVVADVDVQFGAGQGGDTNYVEVSAREELDVDVQVGVGQGGGDNNYVDVGVRDEKREERVVADLEVQFGAGQGGDTNYVQVYERDEQDEEISANVADAIKATVGGKDGRLIDIDMESMNH
ncbi:hypothetical protein N7540_003002 [Penicillium herquei]|nr:hypothetical protein N7540_003002 [Penicillium herquei]